MSDEADQDDKTEDPSPEKRRKAREEGNIARSKDAGSVVATMAALLLISSLGASGYRAYHGYAQECFRAIGHLDQNSVGGIAAATLRALALLTLPVGLAAAVAGIAIGAAETGLMLNWTLLEPKWSRIDPLAKLGKLFSPSAAAANTTLTILRVAALAFVSIQVISRDFVALERLPRMPMEAAISVVLSMMGRIAFWSTLALALLSAADYGQSWWRLEKSLRMTRQEMKDEMHQQEGDPKMKGRIRQRARELARKGLIQEVKRADVIVANPTHFAVALRYRPEEGAPVVTAKGVDDMAQQIKKIAAENGIPIVEEKPLARALHAGVKVGRRIPMEFYQPVANLLAYVYRVKRRGLRA